MMSFSQKESTFIVTALVLLLPFFSFALTLLFARAKPRLSAALSIVAISASLIGSVSLLMGHWQLRHPILYSGKWLLSGDIFIPFGFLLDPISLLMLTLVAFISFLVQIYSLGYMAGDPGFSRYYAFQSLFASAMMALTISASLLQLYVFWELVGLSSYLLIGFWYERFSATQAGKKAFLMTRLGDTAFFLGLLLVLLHFGNVNILELNGMDGTGPLSQNLITFSALLIFGGIVGKSAQFPLLTWLPDAMEGPTPVSALLHSATMVAAGVFLFVRLFPFFSLSPVAMDVFLTVGAISMLMAATMAMINSDIKQVWAYSTISQLGFMIMGLAAGSHFGGLFHLITHAGFKALLFLCAGVWVHRYQTNDLFEIGKRGGRSLKVPTVCILLAAAALAGLPPLSGFFSKEVIISALAGQSNPIWVIAGFVGTFLTAYYAARAVCLILFPKEIEDAPRKETKGPGPAQGENLEEGGAYWVMALPLVALAGITLVLGFFQSNLAAFLIGSPAMDVHGGEQTTWFIYVSLGLSFFGIGLAWHEFGRRGASRIGFGERVPWVKKLFAERWYMDHFYRYFVDYVIDGIFSNLLNRNERQVLDGEVDAIARFVVGSGRVLSLLQSGILRHNLTLMLAALALIALYFFVI